MNDEQLLRHSRHILLDDIGIEGVDKLRAARVLVVGAGGLGSPALLYLASAGVGRIVVVDDDHVELSNLQRQVAHQTSRIGQPKVESARQAMHALNPEVQIEAIAQRADAALLERLLPGIDVVLDCSDNFATRHAVNAACVRYGIPLVSGAAVGFDAQVTVCDPRHAASPCYACLFPPDPQVQDARCATMGVFAPLVGIVGTVQAAEALKLIVGIGSSLAGRLQLLDARSMQWTEIRVARDAACPVCANRTA